MYAGVGLHTPRGSGTAGYVQANKFSAKPSSSSSSASASASASAPALDAAAPIPARDRKPNEAILEHERKRSIELKLLVLGETLADQGYTDPEISSKIDEARMALESAAPPVAAVVKRF